MSTLQNYLRFQRDGIIKHEAIIEVILDWRCILKGLQGVEGQGTLAEHLNNKFCK